MTTFAQAKKTSAPKARKGALKLSVGSDQLSGNVHIDYDAFLGSNWVVAILSGDQFGFQVHEHPLKLDAPVGMIIRLVDENGAPIPAPQSEGVSNETGTNATSVDQSEDTLDMSIMDAQTTIETLKSYIGDGQIEVIEGKFPAGVRVVQCPINPDMLN